MAGLLPVERALATARAAGFEGRAAALVIRAFANEFGLELLISAISALHRTDA